MGWTVGSLDRRGCHTHWVGGGENSETPTPAVAGFARTRDPEVKRPGLDDGLDGRNERTRCQDRLISYNEPVFLETF